MQDLKLLLFERDKFFLKKANCIYNVNTAPTARDDHESKWPISINFSFLLELCLSHRV
jgi:hypothetical protein